MGHYIAKKHAGLPGKYGVWYKLGTYWETGTRQMSYEDATKLATKLNRDDANTRKRIKAREARAKK